MSRGRLFPPVSRTLLSFLLSFFLSFTSFLSYISFLTLKFFLIPGLDLSFLLFPSLSRLSPGLGVGDLSICHFLPFSLSLSVRVCRIFQISKLGILFTLSPLSLSHEFFGVSRLVAFFVPYFPYHLSDSVCLFLLPICLGLFLPHCRIFPHLKAGLFMGLPFLFLCYEFFYVPRSASSPSVFPRSPTLMSFSQYQGRSLFPPFFYLSLIFYWLKFQGNPFSSFGGVMRTSCDEGVQVHRWGTIV